MIMIAWEGYIDTVKQAGKRPKGVTLIIIVTEYSDNSSETTPSYLQYSRYEPNATKRGYESFKFKVRITEKHPDDVNAKNAETVVPFKY